MFRIFHKKIVFKTSLIIMVGFIILIFFCVNYIYYRFNNFIKQQAVTNAMQITEQIRIGLDDYFKQIFIIAKSAYIDKNVSSILKNANNGYSYVETERIMQNYFSNISINRENMVGVAVTLKDGRAYYENAIEFSDINYNFSFELWGQLYEKYKSGDIALVASPLNDDKYRGYYVLIKSINSFEERRTIGYILFFIKEQGFENILTNIYLKNSGEINLYDKHKKLMYGDINSNNNLNNLGVEIGEKNGMNFYDEEGQWYLLVYNKSKFLGYFIIAKFELELLMEGENVLQTIRIVSVVLALFISLILSVIISNRLSKKIRLIVKKLERVGEGGTNVNFQSSSEDEIGEISNSIGLMIEKLEKSNKKKVEYIKKSKDALINLKEAEFEVLQNQINPHFLYNTLDTIRMKALTNKDIEVSEMTRILSKFFRFNISKGKDIVLIREEIEHVQSYLEIQKYRYKDRLETEIDISEEILDFDIIKLILQPIVENAVIHGLEPLVEGGYIKIHAKWDGDEIIFKITDNGIGIKPGKLKEINEQLNDNGDHPERGIGLININQRIKFYYGENYGLNITSNYKHGTCVSFNIPSRRMKHD